MSTVTASETGTGRGAPRGGGGYVRPSASQGNNRFEVASWFFMRLSGLALIFLVLYHLVWWNLVIGVEHLDAGVVIERWQNPWWRFFNFAMVSLALLHGWNGARYVIEDYIRRPAWQMAVKAVVYVVIGVTLAMGIWALIAFDPAAYYAR